MISCLSGLNRSRQVFHASSFRPQTAEDIQAYYTGKALNSQAGYIFRNNIELAFRYTDIIPSKFAQPKRLREYTLGISRYIYDHKIKFQSDYSLLRQENLPDSYRIRFQVELSI